MISHTNSTCPTLFKLQCGTEVWSRSSSSCSPHQTLHSEPRWNVFSSHQLFLQNHRKSVRYFSSKWKVFFSCIIFGFTFSHEGRNFEIHNWDCRVVGHAVLFHIIKLHSTCNLFLLFSWRRQTQKVAEFVYFPCCILKTQWSGIIIAL